MIAMSRNRGNSDETIIDTAAVITTRAASTSGNSSHVHVGVTPNASRNTSTTTRLSPRLNRLVTTTESGITRRGNWVLRTTDSWLTIELTAALVASWKKPNSTMLNRSSTA